MRIYEKLITILAIVSVFTAFFIKREYWLILNVYIFIHIFAPLDWYLLYKLFKMIKKKCGVIDNAV